MKKPIAYLFFYLIFINIFSSCTNEYKGIESISEQNNFKITFPDQPTIHDPVFRSDGKATIKIDQYDFKEDDLYFNASSYTYSEDLIKNAIDVDSLLDNFIQNFLFDNKISVTNKTNIKIKEHPGKEYKIKFNDNERPGLIRVFVMATNKLQVNMVTKHAKTFSDFNLGSIKAAHCFLDSFELINEY